MLGDLLPNIDLIGIPVSMNLFGREKVKTRFGGICSIFLFGFVIWAIYNASQDLFSTLNPKIVSYDFYKDDPRAITLSRESFPFGFSMQAPESLNYRPFKDPSIFTIQISHQRVDTIPQPDGSAIQRWTVTEIKTEKCPPDYFSGQASSLGSMSLNSVYCIAEDQPKLDKLEIQGVLSSPVYQAIFVEISMCNNSTSNNTCAPQETINKYLDGAWFNMVYINMVVNPQNYTHPNNTYKDIYYTMIDPRSYRESEVNLGYVEISTDSGWFTEDYHPKTYTKVNQIKEDISTIPHPDKLLILCSITVDQLETYYTRSYKKIQSVLAEVAGVANLALIIMTLATGPFMRIKFRESLMNELFEFRVPQHPNSKFAKKNTLTPVKKHNKKFKLKIEKNIIGTETNNIVLNPHKTEVVTNLNSSHDYMPAIKSPLFSEQATLFDSPTLKDSNRPNDSPTKRSSPDKRILTDEMIKNHRDLRAINSEYIINDDDEVKPDEIYEGKKQKIKSSLHLEKRIGVKNKTSKPKIKSLRDEDSLHLSFDSDIQSSDREPPKENNHKNLQASEFDNKDRDSEMRNIQENINQDTKEKVDHNITRINIPSKTSSFVDKIKEFHAKEFQKLNISIWQYISWLVLGPKSRVKKKKIFEEGLKQVNERLDIINVMKKLRELDKFRALLLDPDQLLLFNNMPKPIIDDDNKGLQKNLGNSYMQLQSLKFVDEAMADDQIDNSINNLKNKINKSEIDKRLIEIFEGQTYQGV